MDYKRKYKRHVLPNPIQVKDSLSGMVLGTLVNLSQEGFLIAGGKPLVVDSLYQLQLNFPVPFCGCTQLNLGVDCLWVDDSTVKGGLFWSGCQIIDCSDADAISLKAMLVALDHAMV